jgi:hypothetical protein
MQCLRTTDGLLFLGIAGVASGISKIDVRPDGLVSITGDTQTAVDAAREQLEIVHEVISVPSQSVGLLIGTKGQQVRRTLADLGLPHRPRARNSARACAQILELQNLANCRMNVQAGRAGGHVVDMIGTRGNVGKAKALIAYTLETIEEERSRQALIGNLNAQLRSLSTQDRLPANAPGRGTGYQARGARRGRGGPWAVGGRGVQARICPAAAAEIGLAAAVRLGREGCVEGRVAWRPCGCGGWR